MAEKNNEQLVHVYNDDPDVGFLACTCRCRIGGVVSVDNTKILSREEAKKAAKETPDVIIISKGKSSND